MNIEVKNSIKPVDYLESMKILEQRVKDVFLGRKSELLWILEHKSIYTAGTSANKKDLLDKNIAVIKTNRGGKYTYHSPGQKVVYFVLNLNNREKDIRKLVNKIENCIIETLKEYKIESYNDSKNIGIWVNNQKNSEKIAAIGIVPCGIKDKGITSLKKMGVKNYDNIEKVIIKKFLNIFL